MSSELIAMIVLNAFLVALLLTFIALYINAKEEQVRTEALYSEKSEAWFKELDRNVDLCIEIDRLKRKIKKLESKK